MHTPGPLWYHALVRSSAGMLLLFSLAACEPAAEAGMAEDAAPHVVAASPVEAGRYIAIVGGCNDCHTEGYLQSEGNVPEDQWLAGSVMGWRGPWGTTYGANLRLRVQEMTEDEWVEQLRTRHANPPMPWMNVNQMHESDARALYRYIQSLGPTGEHVPAMVPPGEEPEGPYMMLQPQNLPAEG